MNHFIEYICRSAVRSEDAICRLNKRMTKLTKCMNRTNVGVMCIGVGAIMVASVVWMQDNEIKALQNKVDNLNKGLDILLDIEEEGDADKTEENTQQEGA